MIEAIYLGSPRLGQLAESAATGMRDEHATAAEPAIAKYIVRMASRPTPFGLFAGTTVGVIGADTNLELPTRTDYVRRTRLDAQYVFDLVRVLEADPALRENLTLHLNTSAHTVAQRTQYVKRVETDGRSQDCLVSVPMTPQLELIMEIVAHTGAKYHRCIEQLVGHGASNHEARRYLGDLIDNQILVSSLEPPITGQEPLDALISALGSMPAPAGDGVLRTLISVRKAVGALDRSGVGVPLERYQDIEAALSVLPAPIDPARLFAVDLFKPCMRMRIGRDLVDDVIRSIQLLHQIGPTETGQDSLAQFKAQFARRYEQNSVPLMEALDDECGIGFETVGESNFSPSPLLAELPPFLGDATTNGWTGRDRVLFEALNTIRAREEPVLTLNKELIDRLANPQPQPLPTALAARVTLYRRARMADGDRYGLVVNGASGPSGARMFGRFCYGDAALEAWVRRHLQREESTYRSPFGAVRFAEIVYLPSKRAANLVARPVLRGYELPCFGRPGSEPQSQLRLSELSLVLRDGKLYLFHEEGGYEVVPRLTTAHATYASSLPVYRFLSALQHEGVCGNVAWSWGALSSASQLPRVVHGNIVFARAAWTTSGSHWRMLRQAATKDERRRALQQLQDVVNLPQSVVLSEGDNELLLDLDDDLAVETLVHELRGSSSARLFEPFPLINDVLPTFGPEGAFAHDIVLPLRLADRSLSASSGPVADSDVATRFSHAIAPRRAALRHPGSEWLYVKLFCGPTLANGVVADRIVPLIRELRDREQMSQWFFIRYRDPEPHIRLRIKIPEEDARWAAHQLLVERIRPDVASGVIDRFSFETYTRETTRYGGAKAISTAEFMFSADSDIVASYLYDRKGVSWDVYWQSALMGIDAFLEDFEVRVQERAELCRRRARELHASLRVRDEYYDAISRLCRRRRPACEELLSTKTGNTQVPDWYGNERIRAGAAQLGELSRQGELSVSLARVCMLFVHMRINRLIPAAAVAHELILLEVLARTYRSLAARIDAGRPASISELATERGRPGGM